MALLATYNRVIEINGNKLTWLEGNIRRQIHTLQKKAYHCVERQSTKDKASDHHLFTFMAKVNLDPRSHWGQGVDVRLPASGKQPEAVGHVRVSILWRHPLQEVAERLGLVVQLDEQHREALQKVDHSLN